MNKRLLIVFLLGFSSGLPLALLSSTMQAWFASAGMPLLTTGLLSLLGLPYVYKILWVPFLDRYSLFPCGKRRSWIGLMQVALLLGFNAMAWLTPSTAPALIAILAFILAFFSATQDAAIDAHRAEYLPPSEHALGASLAICGYRLALLIAGGFALIMADKIGWAWTYRLMGMFMSIGLLATIWSAEPSTAPALTKQSLLASFVAPLQELWQRPGALSLLLFIIFYKLGEVFTTSTSGIVMPFLIQGLGFSLSTIGYVNKVLGIAAILFGGICAGFLLLHWSLYRALWIFGLLQALTNALFVVLALNGKNVVLLGIAVSCDNFAAGMGSTALVAFFMRLVNKQFTATQFSLLVAVSSLPRIFSGPIAAMLQMTFGWVGLYQLSCLFALGFIPFLRVLKTHMDANNEPIFTLHKPFKWGNMVRIK